MKKISVRAGAAVAAAMVLVLSACGGGASGGGGDGVLEAAYLLPAMPIDPHHTTSDIAAITYVLPVYDQLTTIGPDGKVVPRLAKSWEFAEDGMSVEFKLEEGVTFSDGAALDAEAVKASLERALGEDSTVAYRFAMIDKIVVVDESTLRIEVNRKAADLPAALSGTGGSIISPEALDNPDLDVNPVGSGPYTVTDLKVGESVTYELRDDYWGPEEDLPQTINVTGIADANARINALRSGQVDLVPIDITTSNQAEDLGDGFELHRYPATTKWSLFLNTTTDVMSDVKVRQALNYAIDREAINESILEGNCTPDVQPLSEGVPGYLEEPPVPYTYDPEKAKDLLAEAGYGDGLEARLLFSQGLAVHEAVGTAVQAQLAEIGVDLEIVKKDPTQAPALYATDGYETYVQTRLSAATPALTLAGNFSEPRFPGPVPEEFTDAIATANDPSLGEDEIQAALETASAVANEQAFDLFVCSYPTMFAHSDAVEGADEMGTGYSSTSLDLRAIRVVE